MFPAKDFHHGVHLANLPRLPAALGTRDFGLGQHQLTLLRVGSVREKASSAPGINQFSSPAPGEKEEEMEDKEEEGDRN